ncbi:MAG TPA: pyrroline-5-carboxylate reductase [Acidimicrobiia bacterium]|jgi:pyrroline-5-carboxylate reductase
MTKQRPTVAIVGAGAMGEALAHGLLGGGWKAGEVVLVARREQRAAEVSKATGLDCGLDVAAAVAGRDVVVVAVKPNDVPAVLPELGNAVHPGNIVVSLAAGVPTTVYEALLPGVAVVRAMPNTPARIAEGVTAVAAGRSAGEAALDVATRVLGAVGPTIVLDEHLMDAVTAVSGTGPAYVFLLAEALVDAAIREGIPAYAAEMLVEQTIRGAGMLLSSVDLTPERLRAQVTSPGGTTAAAVHLLEERGFRALVEDAVRAASLRAKEMGSRVSGSDS